MEEKETASPLKSKMLISSYGKHFRNIQSTFHPTGIPGEIAGKSANVAYAAGRILEKYRDSSDGDNVILTIIGGTVY